MKMGSGFSRQNPHDRRSDTDPRAGGETASSQPAGVTRRSVLAGGAALTLAARLAARGQARGAQASALHYRSAIEVAARLRSGELSPVVLTEEILGRIERLEPRLHAYATVTADRALAAARKAEAEIGAGHYLGPLHGIPVAVKDLIFTAGVATLGGLEVRRGQVPTFDATVVRRLEGAGAVLLGKLNTTEGAMSGYHTAFEIPRNPWGEDRWPGVSSSGSGVATAAGLCFASLGTDTGGSIRYPSAANGIVGLKPTWGRVSRHGVLDLAPSLDHVGPMTRRVADAAAVLQVIAGPDPEDATSLPAPVPDFLAELEQGIDGVRIGWDGDYATAGVPAHVATAVRQAVGVLERQGAEIVEVAMPEMDPASLQAWQTLCAAEAAAAHAETFPARAEDYGRTFRAWLEQGRAVTGLDYAAAHERRLELSGGIRKAFEGIDLLACPSVFSEAFVYEPEEAYGGLDLERGMVSGVPLSWFEGGSRFTIPYDYNGYPTLSLPCGVSPDDLPLSLQLVGHPLSEALLCRAGHAFETATEWHLMHPPV